MKEVYIAGPLFTESDMTQRKYEGQNIRRVISTQHGWLTNEASKERVFNPIESPINFKDMSPTAAMIFKADYDVIEVAKYFFFDISTLDVGTFVELGQALELRVKDPSIKIYPVMSDIRVPAAGNYEGRHVPTGNNQYMVGALDFYGIRIYGCFSDALEAFTEDYTQ